MKKTRNVNEAAVKPKKSGLKMALSLTALLLGVAVTVFMSDFTKSFLNAMDEELSKGDS